jgi:hypothetical protein
MATVPSNLIPSRITQLPEAPVADPAGYFPIVISGVTYKVQFSQINQNLTVPPSRAINAGTGLTGGGTLSHDITIAVANGGIGDNQLDTTGVAAGTYGNGQTIPVITVNTKGRVTSLSTVTVAQADVVPTSRQIIAGEGLAGGGNLTANRTLSIDFSSSNPVSLGVASPGTATKAAREDHVHPALDLSDTSEITGTLPLGRGGTGSALSPVPGAIAYSSGSELVFGSVGSIGQILVSGGNGAYTWGTALVVAPVAANLVYAGPASGGDANSAFRLLVNADIPATLTDKTLASAVISNAPALTAVSGSITNFIATTATISDLSATVGTVETLDGSSWTVTNFTATSATISNFTFTSSTVTDLTATNLTATSATITKLTSPSANITTLLTSSGTITNLVATTASATVGRIGSATITDLVGTSASITTLSGTALGYSSGNVTVLTSDSATLTNLVATSGTITTLTSTSATVTNLGVTSLTVSSLSLTNATFTSATITTLTSTSAGITNLSLGSLVISSTTLVANLNADLLDGESGSYYLDLANATGTLSGGAY